MISTLLDRLFQRSNVTSGTQVKQRLKFILAHDRAAIEPQVFENMRHEIMRVVSRYVELDEGSLDIRLESDKRMTALIANLPIRMVREELPDLISLFDQPESELTTGSDNISDAVALEMDQFADEALDAIAAQESTKNSIPVNPESLVENSNAVAERTVEVSQKLRTAANKSPQDVVTSDDVVERSKSDQNDSVIVEVQPEQIKPASPEQPNPQEPQNIPQNILDNVADDDAQDLDLDLSSDQLELSLDIAPSPSDVLTVHEIVVDDSHEIFGQRQEE